jgi:glucose-induced degradation protein 8
LIDSTEALDFGQKKLTSFQKVTKYIEKLEVLFP